MASDGSTAAAINAAISSADQRHTAPEQRRWKGYWTKYWCFRSHKREKRIVPAARPHGASDSAREWPPAQAVLALAPPSSPASFVNSSVQSPASFTLSLSAASASMCSPGPANTMFTIGPYAHETQLVSPPVFSTFTTEPSTAPFTPPPELAHLTTPSSPDVPFAQYVASSLKAKAAARETISPLSTSALASPCDTPASYTPHSGHLYLGRTGRDTISPRSTSTLASPCETPASYTPTSIHLYPRAVKETISARSSSLASPCDTPASYTPTSSHLYLGSPVGRLVSSSMEYSSKDTILEDAFPARSYTSSNHTVPSFPTFDPFVSPTFNHVPFAALILPSDSTSRPEDLSAPVVPEPHVHKDSSNLSDAGETVQNSVRELEKRMTGSLPLEEHNSGRADINGGAPQIDVASSTSTMKGNIKCSSGRADSNGGDVASSTYNTDGRKRFQKSCSCEFDENRDPIFLTARNNEDWNVLVENAHQIKVADALHSMEDGGDERLVKSPAPLESDE